MENLETQGTYGTQDTGRRQTKHNNTTQKTKKMSSTIKNQGLNPGAREGYAVPVSYKTSACYSYIHYGIGVG